MSFLTLTTAPAATDFTPLNEHQQQTPGTFFGAKPVLHLHTSNAQLLVSQPDLENQSTFPDLRPPTADASSPSLSSDGRVIIPNIDVWVTSSHLLLFSAPTSRGVSIPYPTITLHAIQRLEGAAEGAAQQGLYMQLLLNDSTNTADDDLLTLELTLVPAADTTPIATLFAAVSACADLNPDPVQDSDSDAEGGGPLQELGGGMPGAGGWITAENVDECVDAEGNFIGFGGANGLGAGAGTVHGRDEEDGEQRNGNYEDAEEEEADGAEEGGSGAGAAEETKWRRTE